MLDSLYPASAALDDAVFRGVDLSSPEDPHALTAFMIIVSEGMINMTETMLAGDASAAKSVSLAASVEDAG